MTEGIDRAARALAAWFARSARPLPWRTTPRDPWVSLVSEFMLQQTQVARVLDRFGPFLARFPTPAALARAHEQEVLALWSGLGYYRRARLLHAAAQRIVQDHGGAVPLDAASLRRLPGVGRYTAGAVASIVAGAPEPIVDGNAARVLMRLHGRAGRPAENAAWLWEASALLAGSGVNPALVNEGLMELGATLCIPRGPSCNRCPLRAGCAARRAGTQESIPAPKAAVRRRVLGCAAVVIRDRRGRVLLERRPPEGMWGGLWQVPTLERNGRLPPRRQAMALAPGLVLRRAGGFTFDTTHRRVQFAVYAAAGPPPRARPGQRWVSEAGLATLGLSNAQARVLRCAGWRGDGRCATPAAATLS